MDRVYEINRNFRNEGISTQHNPEFTMLEFYQAYANYHDLMDLTEELIKFVAMEVNGTTVTNSVQWRGSEIDLGKWTKLSMREAIIKFWPEVLKRTCGASSDIADIPSLRMKLLGKFLLKTREFRNSQNTAFASELLITSELETDSLGKVIATIFESLAEGAPDPADDHL
jgi:lysyl-tRNA synthetase class 2